MAAEAALKTVSPAKAADIHPVRANLAALGSADLVLAVGIELAFGNAVENLELKDRLTKTLLSQPLAINDMAEAATILLIGQRFIDHLSLGSSQASPADKIVSLCRRFPDSVDCLQKRQRGRGSFSIADEYDVQDLLHSILRLHFDDVRPEEVTPSYAGNSSRVDFYLRAERVVVEAKMTRQNLKQKEVTDELIIDAARYSQMDHVDTLICLIYDPQMVLQQSKDSRE